MDTSYCHSRRRFMGAAAEAAALSALGLALRPFAAIASAGLDQLTLYDPRFPTAAAVASKLAGAGRLLPIQGDPTSLLMPWAAPGAGSRLPGLQGVTTESLPFCLHQCAPGRTLRQRRLDRDLFIWHLEGP